MRGPGEAAGSGYCALPTAGEGGAAPRAAVSWPGPRGWLAPRGRNFPRVRSAAAGPREEAAGAPCCPKQCSATAPAPQIHSFPSLPAQPAEDSTRPALRRSGFHPLSCSFSLLQETESWLPRPPVTNGSPWTQSRTGSGLDALRISRGGQRTSWKESGEEKKEQERRGPLSGCDDGEEHRVHLPVTPPTLPHGHHQRPQLCLLRPGQPGLLGWLVSQP